jgi:competence protein ComEA
MFKKILAVTALLYACASFAAVDANKGSPADLDALKGVGPAMSKRIVDARQQGAFKDWPDFMQRVKGVKEKTAAKLSGQGLTVNGEAFTGAPAAPAARVSGQPKPAKTPATATK